MPLIHFMAPALAFIIKRNVECLGSGLNSSPIRPVLQLTVQSSCSRAASQILNLVSSPKQVGTPFLSTYFPRSLEIYVYKVSGIDRSAVCSHAPPRGDGLNTAVTSCSHTKGLFLMTEDGVISPGSTLIIRIRAVTHVGEGTGFHTSPLGPSLYH